MLWLKRFWDPLAAGEITVTFRRWKAPQVLVGGHYRTPGGIIEVEEVAIVEAHEVTDVDARRAGHESAASLLADLPDRPGLPIYRISFHLVEEPDPRAVLADSAELTDSDLADIDKRLARLDRASSHGAWTRQVLDLIAAHPRRRAPDLAQMVGMETAPFKLDVRKLKNLGLTISHRIGYELSPRGAAYLTSRDPDPPVSGGSG
ncbi:MAG TPA: hypothetical protein VFY46_04395 [Acidimicrobiia bacterium]|nr:hypothetical protein [Acidimicrobiia bacterium]